MVRREELGEEGEELEEERELPGGPLVVSPRQTPSDPVRPRRPGSDAGPRTLP